MSSFWLKEYVLECLGCEIRKAAPLHNETTQAATANGMNANGQARLVQIVGRGQGRPGGNAALRENGSRMSTRSSSAGNDWWNPSRRGKSPNLAKHTNAWILVSDGSHSARLYLTTGALREVFDWDNDNNNEDNLFRRGCCVMLKDYSFEYNNANDHQQSQHLVHSVQLKVSSLEPKPGFNFHQGAKTNNTGHNDSSSEAIIRPVMEETDVLYGLQALARQRQQQASNDSSGSMATSEIIARDWDIAFGRLSKGRLSISTTTGEEANAIRILDGKKGLDDILKLAEAAASTDDAIRDWEMAKKEFGILTMDSTNDSTNNNDRATKPTETPTQTQADGQDGGEENNDQDREDLSRLYIQNVLANSDDEEDESQNDKSDENVGSGDEEPVLPETQPKEILTAAIESHPSNSNTTGILGTGSLPSMTTKIATAAGVGKEGESKTVTLGNKQADDDSDSDTLSVTMLQTQPAEEEEKEAAIDSMRTRRKRPRANSFESGTASNLTLEEAISIPGSTRKSTNRKRGRQKQQAGLQQQQENSQDNTGIWESMKEQLFEPGRTVLYCVPLCRLPSSNDSKDDESMLITPKRSTANIKNLGSGASIGTNFTSWTPNPSSGAYYRKYGLARWLSRNTSSERG